jgi:hypothetical protein
MFRKDVIEIVAYLLQRTHTTHAQLEALLACSLPDGLHSATDDQLMQAYAHLLALGNTMQAQRRRIFAKMRSICGIPAHQHLDPAAVWAYLKNIVGLKLPPNAANLNDLDTQTLRQANAKLDAIERKLRQPRRGGGM